MTQTNTTTNTKKSSLLISATILVVFVFLFSFIFANTDVNASYRRKTTYRLTLSASTGGTVAGGGTYSSGATRTITATPSAGYTFSSWTGTTGCSGTASHTILMNANKTCSASFTPIITYSLSLSAGVGGTVTGGGIYNSGTTRTITATPNTGYSFSNWTGSTGCSGTASHTILIDSNKSCTAAFTPTIAPVVTYTLVLTAAIGGTVNVGGTYNSGATTTITATPSAGYVFSNWTGSTGCSGTASHTILINADTTCIAYFTQIDVATPLAPVVSVSTAGSSSTWSWPAIVCSTGNVARYQYRYSIQPSGFVSSPEWNATSATSVVFTTSTDNQTYTLAVQAQCYNSTVTSGWSASGSASYSGMLNVKDYGAKGDGVTDDTTSLHNAFNAAAGQSKTAWLPSGTYYLASSITLPDRLSIQGEGMDKSWIQGGVTAGSNEIISNLKIGDRGKTFYFTNTANNTTLTNVHFRGGGGLSGASPVIFFGGYWGAIYQHDITFNGCEIERNLGVQAGTFNDYSKPIFNNVTFNAVATAGGPHVTNVLFENTHFGVSNGEAGHNTGSPRFQVEIWQDDVDGVAQVQGFQHIDFINNIIEAADSGDLDYSGAHNSTTGYCLSGNSIISGNLFKGNGYLSDAPWASDITLEPACDMQITNNTFWQGRGYSGVAINSTPAVYGYSQNNIFSHNTIDFTIASGLTYNASAPAFNLFGINNEFSYNTINIGSVQNLFNIIHGGNNKIANNNITMNSTSTPVIFRFGGSYYAINTTPSTNNQAYSNTFITPNAKGSIYVDAASGGNSVSNNTFKGKGLPTINDSSGSFQFIGNTLSP